MNDILNNTMTLVPVLFELYMPADLNPFVQYAMLWAHLFQRVNVV